MNNEDVYRRVRDLAKDRQARAQRDYEITGDAVAYGETQAYEIIIYNCDFWIEALQLVHLNTLNKDG